MAAGYRAANSDVFLFQFRLGEAPPCPHGKTGRGDGQGAGAGSWWWTERCGGDWRYPRDPRRELPLCSLEGGRQRPNLSDLTSGNICYKLLNRLGGADAIGPILMGMKKPIHVLQRGDDVANIVNMAAIAVVDAQNAQR